MFVTMQGDFIYAQILQPQIQKLGDLLQIVGTCTVAKFNVRASKTSYIPFETKIMIEFMRFTTVFQVQDPYEYFSCICLQPNSIFQH
jgi:hypothetical protein